MSFFLPSNLFVIFLVLIIWFRVQNWRFFSLDFLEHALIKHSFGVNYAVMLIQTTSVDIPELTFDLICAIFYLEMVWKSELWLIELMNPFKLFPLNGWFSPFCSQIIDLKIEKKINHQNNRYIHNEMLVVLGDGILSNIHHIIMWWFMNFFDTLFCIRIDQQLVGWFQIKIFAFFKF